MSSSQTSSSSTEGPAPTPAAVAPGPKAVAVLEAPEPLQPLHDIRCQSFLGSRGYQPMSITYRPNTFHSLHLRDTFLQKG
mgnify:CR=1 FL=1